MLWCLCETKAMLYKAGCDECFFPFPNEPKANRHVVVGRRAKLGLRAFEQSEEIERESCCAFRKGPTKKLTKTVCKTDLHASQSASSM